MSASVSHGAQSRRPVYSGKRRIGGLYARTLADGSTVYDVALRLGGKVRRHRLVATTKTDAVAELRTLQTDYARGEEYRSPAAAVTVAELLDDFTRHMRARVDDPDAKRRRSIRTVEHYDYQLRRHVLPLLGSVPACDVTVAQVRRVLDAMAAKRLSPSSRTGLLTAFSSLMRYGVKQGALERNPVRDLDRDDRPGAGRLTEPRYLSRDELERLLGEMGDTFRPVAAACAYAGLRVNEALGLRWRDLDLKVGRLTVTGQLGPRGERVPVKTAASAASLPILPPLAAELRAHRARIAERSLARVHRDALVFTTSRGKPQGVRNALRAVYQAGDAAGLNGDGREPVGLHDLRHSFVAIALASGLTLPEASALARHANPRITAMAYAGLSDEAREQLGAKFAAAFGA
jgi:integrase